MGLLFPRFLRTRRAVILASALSITLVVALWSSFAADAPHSIRSKWRHAAWQDHGYQAPFVPLGAGAPLKHHEAPLGAGGNASQNDPLCARHPDLGNIGVVMKTGATEAFARLPTQLLTMLRCVDEYLIFSDMEQNIAGVHVHDVLDTVLDEAKTDNSDFDIYRDQQACEADVRDCTAGHAREQAGWNLDKYKNVHMAEKTWSMMPGKDWYLFIDADTYVLWNTLVAWLRQLDPGVERYLGSVAYMGDFPFSHGGSGYILSRAAMEVLVGKNPGIGNKYDVEVHNVCCGDYFFSKVAKDLVDMDVRNAWPTINGEQPFSLPFGPTHWCHPIVTMHHISTEQIAAFWEWEADHYASLPPDAEPEPILMKDIYDAFFAPRLVPQREGWNNFADTVYFLDAEAKDAEYDDGTLRKAVSDEEKKGAEKEAHKSVNHCKRACEENKECFQYRFKDGVCGFAFTMRLGRPAPKDGSVAGWNMGKIEKWTGKRQMCDEVLWPDV